jgi:hypothetical protein
MTRISTVFKGTNAELLTEVFKLYPLGARVLDPTWGAGGWWLVKPRRLVRHDLYTFDNVDFRHLPHRNASFDSVVFDPPYVSVGGRVTAGPKFIDMAEKYGMHSTEKSPGKHWDNVITPGVFEIARVLKPGGYIYVKVQDYVSSGRKHWCVQTMFELLEAAGFTVVDQIIHVGGTGPQPLSQHAHAAHSVLFVGRRTTAIHKPPERVSLHSER